MTEPDYGLSEPEHRSLERGHAEAMAESDWLARFVRESNRIEGILRAPHRDELVAHAVLLAKRPALVLPDVVQFVAIVTDGKPLRNKPGMNVMVGGHLPTAGGPLVEHYLECLLEEIAAGDRNPYEAHVAYESLHPFMDGNGRSGRAIWAWHMVKERFRDPFELGFLHEFYYQALDHTQARERRD